MPALQRNPIDIKGDGYRMDYSGAHNKTQGHERKKRIIGIKWPRFLRRFKRLPAPVQKRIIRFAVTSSTYLIAINPVTKMEDLNGDFSDLIRPFSRVDSLRKMAEEVFWVQNTVAITGLQQLDRLSSANKGRIKRLYIIHDPDMAAKYGKPAVTGVFGKLKAKLKDLTELKYLALAFTYEDLPARLQDAKDGEDMAELLVVVEAVSKLSRIKEKVVLLKEEGEEAGVDNVVATGAIVTAGVVKELLALEPGDGLML
ncbi:hypothetical protein LTR36_004881 [Oleoguttula mirabilis]|uniref:Uncharacterized protein n=1 Tax=Oleoguttula mirabilis TaxID=1507867 RepID=A0AAV9JFQ4_9PEZI|nr:hypothetical protein LTR36_004881 [Oleoguttula mirabilis]